MSVTIKPGLPSAVDRLERKPELEKPNLEPTANQTKAQPFSDFLEDRLRIDNKADQTSAAARELKFSAHAQARLASRGIELSPQDLVRMQEAVNKARDKGSKESLILSDHAAFVVSVKNNTVITAVDRAAMKENVFTNIDSTILI